MPRSKSNAASKRRTTRPRSLETLETRALLSATGYGGSFAVYTDSSQTEAGLVGSYFNQNLAGADQMDWRASQSVSGSRVDDAIFFPSNSFGIQSEVGVTGGSDENWDSFSVQWDGVVQILDAGTQLATRSDDGSRMWIDVDQDGSFETNELVNNNWGSPQVATTGVSSSTLATGSYAIRVQYHEDFLNNTFSLIANPIEPATEPDPSGLFNNHIVRVGYVVPQDRTAQADGVENLQDLMPRAQDWYREQMDRNGFGEKTFQFETLEDGVTPKIHLVDVGVDQGFLQSNDPFQIYSNTITAGKAAGLTIDEPGELWVLIPESHVQNPDGSISNGIFLGSGQASTGSHAGIAVLSSDVLFRLDDATLTNDQNYAGQVVPEVGPYPLVQDVSFPWFEGGTFSSIASSAQGALIHELSHGFALGHDFRNDMNFHGNLMGNGFRGFRGASHPDLYPTEDTRLSYGAALALNSSRYFFPDQPFTGPDDTRPGVSISTSGSVNPVNGLLEIDYLAQDFESGVASALLRRNGVLIGEKVLSGSIANETFATPFFQSGSPDTYTISVLDVQGNRRDANVQITVNSGFNAAPQPSIKAFRSMVDVGDSLTLDASGTVDPDHSVGSVQVEWDLNGDGIFDTSPTTTKTLTTSFASPGTYLVSARTTDPAGASSLSAPIAIRVNATGPSSTLAAFDTFSSMAPYDATVAGFETTGSVRNVTTSIGSSLSEGAAAAPLQSGPGVSATNSWFDDRFAPKAWNSKTLSQAIKRDDYLTFTLTVDDDKNLDLNSIGANLFTQNSRQRTFALLSSATGFQSADVLTTFGGPVVGSNTFGVETRNADLSSVAGLDGLTGTIEFRIYAYGPSVSRFEAVGIANQPGSDLWLDGELTTTSIAAEPVSTSHVTSLIAGEGLSEGNSWFDSRFAPTGWGSVTLAAAIGNDDYLSFSVTSTSEPLDVSGIDAMLFSQNQRPRNFALLSSRTGFTSADVLTDFGGTVLGTGNFGQEVRSADLSSISALQNVSGTVEFRIYVYGSNPNLFEAAGIGNRPGSDLILSTTTPTSSALVSSTDALFEDFGDLSGNGEVGFEDFLILSSNFGREGTPPQGDLDGDGLVGFTDFLLFSRAFGSST